MKNKIVLKDSHKTEIGGDYVFVIAEIGKNQIQTKDERSVDEYVRNAKELISEAKKSGADAVKLQTHEVEDEQLNIGITSPHFKGSDRYSWVKRNTKATPLSFWKEVKAHADKEDILFFSTPMSRKAAQKLTEIGVDLWKVGSGDVQDHILLDYLIETKKPIIISTGMVGRDELDELVSYITGKGAELIVLYCISKYPAPKEYFNLASIEYLQEKYPDVVIGFSDHSLGDDVSLAAAKLGAKVIEKHFSTSREHWGSDHKVSMSPDEMKKMIDVIRAKAYNNIDTSLYYGKKNNEFEGFKNEFRPYFNKSLMAGVDISKGTVITKEMVYAMRPKMYAKGLPAERFEEVLGKTTTIDLKKFDPITEDTLS